MYTHTKNMETEKITSEASNENIFDALDQLEALDPQPKPSISEDLRQERARRSAWSLAYYYRHKKEINAKRANYPKKPKQICEYVTIYGKKCEASTFKKYCGAHMRYAISRGIYNIEEK